MEELQPLPKYPPILTSRQLVELFEKLYWRLRQIEKKRKVEEQKDKRRKKKKAPEAPRIEMGLAVSEWLAKRFRLSVEGTAWPFERTLFYTYYRERKAGELRGPAKQLLGRNAVSIVELLQDRIKDRKQRARVRLLEDDTLPWREP